MVPMPHIGDAVSVHLTRLMSLFKKVTEGKAPWEKIGVLFKTGSCAQLSLSLSKWQCMQKSLWEPPQHLRAEPMSLRRCRLQV